MLALANSIHKETGARNLCLAGGVALNAVANQRIATEGPFEHVWVQPAAGDAGGALGAALAIKSAMDKHDLKGTIRLYGTPAEETVIGKVYMTLDGVFDDLDVCLHWHPGDKNNTYAGKCHCTCRKSWRK